MIKEREDVVSVWLGGCTDSAAFLTYMEEGYTEDGDLIPSQFALDFGLDYYEIGLREAEYLEEGTILDYLAWASYSSAYAQDVVKKAHEKGLHQINCGVLLFDYEVDPNVRAAGGLTFIGVFDYNKQAPMLAVMKSS